MKLSIEKVKIENFLSIGEADVSLKDRGYCLIQGINNNPKDNARSNGSGKSSLTNAVAWCLTGETIQGVKDVVNMFADGGTAVELDFTVDGDSYKLCRYKEHHKYKTDLKIYKNGQDISGKGIRDTQALLKEYLPDLTSDLIGSVIILGQGLPQRFTNNTPSGRKEVLEKLSKSDFMIDDLKKRLQERKSYLNKQLRDIEDSILADKTKIQTLETQIQDCEKRLGELDDPVVYDQLIKRAQEKIKYIEDKIVQLKEDLNNYRSILDIKLSEKAQIVSKFSDEKNEVEVVYLKEKQRLEQERSLLEFEKDTLQKEIDKARAIKDICPTCGQKIPGVFKPDTIKQELEIGSLQTKLNLLYEDRKQLQEQYNTKVEDISSREKAATSTLYDEINSAQAHVHSLERSIASQQSEKDMEQKGLSRIQQLKATYDATVKNINDTISANKEEIAKLTESSVYKDDVRLDYQKRIDIVNKFTTITNRDFRGYLLHNVIEFIDKKAKEYCQEVFNTQFLDFILDGNNIDIKYCNKQYEILSGGEKQKIDLIIQFAIRDMLCQFLDFRCDMLVVDECFDALDSDGCDKLLNLFSRKFSDVSSLFIISHHTDLAIPCDSIITITKNEYGVSSVA